MTAYSPIDATQLGVERLVRMPELIARTSLSRATIYRKMGKGEFPQSIAIGANSAAWYASDVERWLASPMDWQPQERAA